MKRRYYTIINHRRTIFDTLKDAREFALNNINNKYVEYGEVIETNDSYEFRSLEIIRW